LPPDADRTLTVVHGAIEAHLGTRQVARVIYGAIIGMALIVVLEEHPPGAANVVALLVATAVAVGLAELYSEVVAAETRTRHRIAAEHVREILDDVLAVGFGICFPSVFFLVAALGAMDVETAFSLAKWSGIGLIGFYGFCAARLAGARLPRALLHGCAAAAIGAALILFKAVVH
jgi:VIT1/CCC1 family predicted Fe2+/Mn2+ transporter